MGTLLIDKLLQTVVTQRASDLHLTVGSPPVLRLHGHMRPLATKVLESSDTSALMKSITPERCQQELQEVGGCDFGFAFGELARFRVAVFKQRGNIGLVLRRIPNEFLTFEQLGLPAIISELIKRPRGLILVTGPTGSGKTTSLASMINWLNHNMDRHIITIEDPIEYFHKHEKSLVNQREIGIDVPDFPEAIRRALRMDPDIILVGEMRDLETTSAAITAAETGHFVLSTLHTNNAAQTIERIIDIYPGEQQNQIRSMLSNTLQAVVCQVLFKRIDQPGMVPGVEILICTPAVRNLIRENRIYEIHNVIETSRALGMQTMDTSIKQLYFNGKISKEDAVSMAHHPEKLERQLVA
jgi:twitching motility protein PilT